MGCNNGEIIKGDPIVKWRTLKDSMNSENNKIHIFVNLLGEKEKVLNYKYVCILYCVNYYR